MFLCQRKHLWFSRLEKRIDGGTKHNMTPANISDLMSRTAEKMQRSIFVQPEVCFNNRFFYTNVGVFKVVLLKEVGLKWRFLVVTPSETCTWTIWSTLGFFSFNQNRFRFVFQTNLTKMWNSTAEERCKTSQNLRINNEVGASSRSPVVNPVSSLLLFLLFVMRETESAGGSCHLITPNDDQFQPDKWSAGYCTSEITAALLENSAAWKPTPREK